ncbi:MAG: methionine--tRNA ligase [Thaumarchaeota archaeon]|nr:methionine--tRNA ligase [Nitrososphaerota archaeon]
MKSERIIITSALPYANGEIHLGHAASTYLPADIFSRFCRLIGHKIYYICATDDYGTPILIRAEQENKTPQEYVAHWNEKHKTDFRDLGISFDFFYKTSSRENLELTQGFFRTLSSKNFIYLKKVSQLYCDNDAKFLPDRYVRGICVHCHAQDQYSDGCEKCGRTMEPGELIEPKCALCGREPVVKQSDHYFFSLSKLSKEIDDWLNRNENLQTEVKNYVLNWIKSGLRDWDITRDISWGVPIPTEEGQGKSLYGWFDNHLCYISSALLHLDQVLEGEKGKDFWNSAQIYHFIGKDIVYHHYLFLPAMRIAEGSFKLPDFMPTRGHLMLHSRKFSKSRGWYVGLREFLDAFPPDYLRYYLASITPYDQTDVNFDWDDLMARINNELVANLGNYIHRTLTFVASRYDKVVPQHQTLDAIDTAFEKKIHGIAGASQDLLQKNQLDRALRCIFEFSTLCNQYFQKKEPWANPESAKTCLYLAVNAVRSLAILLSPYLPFSMQEVWEQMNLEGSVHDQKWEKASVLTIDGGHSINQPKVLFKKIEQEEIETMKSKLGKIDR